MAVWLRPAALFCLVLLFRGATAAEPAKVSPGATNAPDARKLIARHLEAAGGEAAIRKQTSRLSLGSFESPAAGASGTVELLQAAPRRMLQKLIVANSATITMGTDGQVAWVNIPGLGVQEMDGLQRDQFIEEADIYQVLGFPARLTNSVVKAPVKIGEVECDVVSGVNRLGKTETMYFGRPDGLLRRWDRPLLNPAGEWASAETYFEDYRDLDGLKLPYKISQPEPADQGFTLIFTSIKNGVEAPDAKFKRPE